MIFGIAYLPYLVVTGRYKYGLRNRFGFLPDKVNSICARQRIIWVHAVSVGEMKAAGILAPLLRKVFPSHTIVFSTVTHTGNKVAKTIATEKEGVFYLPFDISFITDKVVRAVKPEVFISMETEFWPNLVDSLYKSGARLILANGRISNRSYPRYKKGKFFISRLLKKFSLILMQSDQDAARIIALGAPKEKVSVTGNLKFDIPLLNLDNKRLELRKKLSLDEKEILIIAGSTHKGEEKAVMDCAGRCPLPACGSRNSGDYAERGIGGTMPHPGLCRMRAGASRRSPVCTTVRRRYGRRKCGIVWRLQRFLRKASSSSSG